MRNHSRRITVLELHLKPLMLPACAEKLRTSSQIFLQNQSSQFDNVSMSFECQLHVYNSSKCGIGFRQSGGHE